MTTALQPAAFIERLLPLLERGQREAARHRQSVLVTTTAAIPSVDPISLFDRAKAQERVLWEQPREGFSLLTIGATARLSGRGEGRFSQVAARWRRLLSSAVVDIAEPGPLPGPIALGGFAFDHARRRDLPWQAYPDALLLVPRFLFASRGDSAWLSLSAMASPDADARVAAEEAADDLYQLLSGEVADREESAPGDLTLEEDVEGERWRETVAAVVRDIRRGAIEKLVLARRLRVCSQGLLDPALVLRRLRTGYDTCTIFAFAWGGSCFLGATPERLVRLDGRLMQADCLAGSAPRGASEEEDRALGEALLADGKERHEHALVVRALREALEPRCSCLSVPETPTLLPMPNLQHLHTPVEGVLKEEDHILQLVEQLHPTPAAGGLPRQSALSLIRAYESFDRGWYAGPLGWIDRRGSGEFVVGIRSALLRGNQALLYAGCGIVADSDPEREYEESNLKLRPMLWALNGKRT